MQANCFSVAAAPAARSAAVAANNSVRVCPSPLPTRSQNASYVAFYRSVGLRGEQPLRLNHKGSTSQQRGVSRRTCRCDALALSIPSLDAMFSAATIFVMPMYGMMLAAPRWHVVSTCKARFRTKASVQSLNASSIFPDDQAHAVSGHIPRVRCASKETNVVDPDATASLWPFAILTPRRPQAPCIRSS